MTNHRKPRWPLFLLLLIAVGLTGCLTIEENYTFKKDGSGTLEYVIDASELFKLMEGLPGKEKTDDDSGKSDMELQDKLAGLRATKGISKVKLKEEKKGAIQRVRFKFEDIAALNRALDVLMPDSTGVQHERFKWEGGTLVRTNTEFAKDLSLGLAGDPSDSTGAQALLQSMHYKYSFKFAQEISGTQHTEGVTKEAVGTKEVRLSTDFAVIAKDPKALDLRISLK
jgi:hypothetical protein